MHQQQQQQQQPEQQQQLQQLQQPESLMPSLGVGRIVSIIDPHINKGKLFLLLLLA